MRRSNFDFSLVALALFLGGCSSLQIPTPSDSTPELRAFLGSLYYQHTAFWPQTPSVQLARPVDGHEYIMAPWIDTIHSKLDFVFYDSLGNPQESVATDLRTSQGLRARSMYRSSSSTTTPTTPTNQVRIKGTLRWNASSPFSLTNPVWVEEVLDLAPQQAEPAKFLRTGIEVDLRLRWKRLNSLSSYDTAFAHVPDSLTTLLQEWNRLSVARGTNGQILLYRPRIDDAFHWATLDTANLALLIRGHAKAMSVVSAGDTVWLSMEDNLAIDVPASRSNSEIVLTDVWQSLPPMYHRIFQPGDSPSTSVSRVPSSAKSISFRIGSFDWYQAGGYFGAGDRRLFLQASWPCQAFSQWRTSIGADRSSPPTGNVNPLNGYFCSVAADTLSFVIGN